VHQSGFLEAAVGTGKNLKFYLRGFGVIALDSHERFARISMAIMSVFIFISHWLYQHPISASSQLLVYVLH